MKIERGEIYWIPLFDELGNKRAITHPHVVIQDSVINQSKIDTVVVCGISSNMKLVNEPGNILLEIDEANLEKRSIIVVSQISVAKKEDIGAFIGVLSEDRMNQIFSGLKFANSFQSK